MNVMADIAAGPRSAGARGRPFRSDSHSGFCAGQGQPSRVLREALGDLLQDEYRNQTCRPRDDAQGAATRTCVGVLILDVSGEENPLRVLDDLAQFVEPGVRVLVIGDIDDMEFYRQATRTLGVLEYLPKPLNHEMVARHFRPLIIGRDPAELQIRAGRIITVTGVRGGVGATTIAANLASHLGEATRRHTLLLDADLHGGTAALMLSAETGDALRTALEHPEKVDDVLSATGSPQCRRPVSGIVRRGRS